MDVPRLRGPKSLFRCGRPSHNARYASDSDSDKGFYAVDGADLLGTTMVEETNDLSDDKPNPARTRGVAEGGNSSPPIANVGTPLRGVCHGKIVTGDVGTRPDTPGNSNVNTKRQSFTPGAATPSATPSSRSRKRTRYRRSQRAREKQLQVILQDAEIDIQQNLAKADGENMCLRSNTTCAAKKNPTAAESKQRKRSAAIIATSTSPARLRSRRGSKWSSCLSNSSASSRRKGTQGKARLCGFAVCGSDVRHSLGEGGECEDCGDGITHGMDELLCSACHRTLGFPVNHLGEGRCLLATQWVEECRASNEGLPATVVDSFKPSTACLCARTDCFYNKFNLFRKTSAKRSCSACGALSTPRWRNVGQRYNEYQLFFTGERGRGRTKLGMAVMKEVMTADNIICNACHGAFNDAVSNGWRPTLKVLLASPAVSIPPQGSPRPLAIVTRSVYEALGRGEVVNSEDVERLITDVRVDHGLAALGNHRNRKIVRKVLIDVSESVSDVCARDESGDNFGDDGRKRCIYLMVMPMQPDVVIKLDREVRRKEEAIQDLQRQLREARDQVDARDTCPPALKGIPKGEYERLQAARIGAQVVREDIYAFLCES